MNNKNERRPSKRNSRKENKKHPYKHNRSEKIKGGNKMERKNHWRTVALILGMLVLILVAISNIPEKSEPIIIKDLTTKQFVKMVELGLIKIQFDIKYHKGDTPVGIGISTTTGNCQIYKDIFGRYYCS